MAFKTDHGGYAANADIKVCLDGGSTWATKLSQIGRPPNYGPAFIVTTDLPDLDYAEKVLSKNPRIMLYAPENCETQLRELKKRLPELCCFVTKRATLNIVLLEPYGSWICPGPLAPKAYSTGGVSIGIHDCGVRAYLLEQLEQTVFDRAKEIV
jgi:hypothetical protein